MGKNIQMTSHCKKIEQIFRMRNNVFVKIELHGNIKSGIFVNCLQRSLHFPLHKNCSIMDTHYNG